MNAPISWRITRRKGGQWVLNLLYPGNRRRQLSCDSKKHAEQRLADALRADEAPLLTSTSPYTLGDGLRRLEEHYGGMVSARTSLAYALEVVEFLGRNTPVQEVTAADAKRLIDHLLRKGNANQTVNAKLSKLRQLQKMSVLYGQVTSLPLLPQNLPIHNRQLHVWTQEQMQLVCQNLLLRDKQQEAGMLVFMGEMGCRFSEAARLKGSDVDLDKQTVRFFKPTKDNKEGNRLLRLTPRAAEAIEPFIPPMPRMRVWTLKHGQLEYQIKKAMAQCGIEMPRPLHTLRHTVGSRLGNAGRSTLEIGAWLGHRSPQSCERYVHMKSEELTRCYEVLVSD